MPTPAKPSIKKKKFRGPQVKTYYRGIVHKSVYYWCKDRKIEQWNRTVGEKQIDLSCWCFSF